MLNLSPNLMPPMIDGKKFTLAKAKALAGSISTRNSKMPGSTYATSPVMCKVGSKLAKVKGSTCHKCYALKLYKMRPSARVGWENNYDKAKFLIETNPELWAQCIAYQINHYAYKSGEYYHRWFDSGDLQSVAMLKAIAMVCKLTPFVKHWLPTREAKIVDEANVSEPNLIIRVSSTMVGDKPIAGRPYTSTVHKKDGPVYGWACPARSQGNACNDCRACWDKSVPNVSYPLH